MPAVLGLTITRDSDACSRSLAITPNPSRSVITRSSTTARCARRRRRLAHGASPPSATTGARIRACHHVFVENGRCTGSHRRSEHAQLITQPLPQRNSGEQYRCRIGHCPISLKAVLKFTAGGSPSMGPSRSHLSLSCPLCPRAIQ